MNDNRLHDGRALAERQFIIDSPTSKGGGMGAQSFASGEGWGTESPTFTVGPPHARKFRPFGDLAEVPLLAVSPV